MVGGVRIWGDSNDSIGEVDPSVYNIIYTGTCLPSNVSLVTVPTI